MGFKASSILCATIVLLAGSRMAVAQVEPPSRGFSSWNFQLSYGSAFREPGNPVDVGKVIGTFENSAGWSWGSSFFFAEILQSDGDDRHAREVYAEWYPSASLTKAFDSRFEAGPLRDVSATLGFNAGSKTSGAAPLVFLPGLTFDLNVPGFKFLSVGAYVYINEGRISGRDNGCHSTTYQVTPSWSLPFSIGAVALSFDGFADFIGSHGQCARQLLTQPQLKLDLGALRAKPGKLYVGVEWQHWDNKFGISGLDESFPQILGQWFF